jgi:hypothetical protein
VEIPRLVRLQASVHIGRAETHGSELLRLQMAVRCCTGSRIVPSRSAIGVGSFLFCNAINVKRLHANHYVRSEWRNAVGV